MFYFQRMTARFARAGSTYTLYSGNHGILQLRDANNRLVNIFLHRDANNVMRVPVPLYLYKV